MLFRLFLFTFRLLLSFHFSIITILIDINIYLLKMKSIGSFKKSFLRQLINQKRAFSNNINEGKQEYKVDEKEIFSEQRMEEARASIKEKLKIIAQEQ